MGNNRLSIMKNNILILSLVFCTFFSAAQTGKRTNYELIVGGGPSWFAYKIENGEKNFTTQEFRLGATVRRSVKVNFSLISGVLVGYKAKFYSTPFSGSMSIVEKVNYQDHPFIEIPLMAAVSLKGFEIQFGGNFRNFFPRNSSVDMLSAQNELGLLAGLSYKVTNKIGISFKYLNGLKRFPYTVSNQGNTLSQTQWNRSAYLMVSYRL